MCGSTARQRVLSVARQKRKSHCEGFCPYSAKDSLHTPQVAAVAQDCCFGVLRASSLLNEGRRVSWSLLISDAPKPA